MIPNLLHEYCNSNSSVCDELPYVFFYLGVSVFYLGVFYLGGLSLILRNAIQWPVPPKDVAILAFLCLREDDTATEPLSLQRFSPLCVTGTACPR